MSNTYDHRVFDSERDPDEIVNYNYRTQLSRISGSTVVIAVDGACRGNGTPNANAGYGVFFGPSSRFNRSGCLPDDGRQTSQRAEIYAAQVALNTLRNRVKLGRRQRVVIITDSDYLAKSMSDYVYKWVNNDWLNAKGQTVINAESLEKLHATIVKLEGQGMRVRFWRVPRAYNQEADELANDALD